MTTYYVLAIFAPLLGSVIAGIFGRLIGDRLSQLVTVLCMAIAAASGAYAFVQVALNHAPTVVTIGNWVSSGDFTVAWSLRFDTLSASMVAMITLISTLIHIYSVGYMSHDATIPRFMSYLSLFTFAMLMLVTADNLLQLFFGWEGVGLASYLLIGYWYDRESANKAAMKAFVVNRVGDLGFALGIALVFFLFGSIEFQTIFAQVGTHQNATYHLFGTDFRALEVIGILRFIGAMGKSAQLGLHTWLPDAMEGPTPVSALIHAATMVTAGVFMMARMSLIMEYAPYALGVVTVIGASTALFAATVGMVQNDIKRIIAYSTCSQLGYMFFAVGVGAYQVGVFHLITHAFFKALLFLGAGSVIHAMSDEQDIRRMGGIWKKIPVTYAMMWIGSLALAGIPLFAGYYSKDAILEVAYASHSGVGMYAFACGIIAAFLTAFYSWRLIILTFHGKPRADQHTMDHVHESPFVMLFPLLVLACGAIASGYLLKEYFIGHDWHEFWGHAVVNAAHNHVMHAMHEVPAWVPLLPTVIGVAGIVTAYVLYMAMPSVPGAIAARFSGVYRFLLNKWYFDELYDAVFVRTLSALARGLWKVGDARIIDGIPNGAAALASGSARQVVKVQTGQVAHYAFSMLIGLVLLVSIFLFFR